MAFSGTSYEIAKFVLTALFLAAPLSVSAQQKTVGLLWNDTIMPSPYRATVVTALKERGLIVGQNLVIDDRVSLAGYAGMPQGASELARAKVDVILAYGATATLAARTATREIPIVMIVGADPIAMGVTSSLAHPTGNVTGVTTVLQELHTKRMQLLKELVPRASVIGVLLAPESKTSDLSRQELAKAATSLKLEIRYADVHLPTDIEPAIAQLAKAGIDALYVHGSTMLAAHAREIVGLVAKYRLPAAYAQNRHFEEGGLIVYGPNPHYSFQIAATYVDRILRGAKPQDLPIERATKLELGVNLKTARTLGIAVPQSLLLRADRIVE